MNQEIINAAIAAISAELEQDGENAVLYKERGRLRAMLGLQEEAMADLREALRLNPALVEELQDGSFCGKIGSCH